MFLTSPEPVFPGYRLVVCAPEGKLTERLRELNIPVHAVPFGPSRGFRTSFASLAHVIEREKPAIVHSHLAYADVIAAAVVNSLKMRRLANRSLTVPTLITTEHGIAGDDAVYHGTSWRSKLMDRCTGCVCGAPMRLLPSRALPPSRCAVNGALAG